MYLLGCNCTSGPRAVWPRMDRRTSPERSALAYRWPCHIFKGRSPPIFRSIFFRFQVSSLCLSPFCVIEIKNASFPIKRRILSAVPLFFLPEAGAQNRCSFCGETAPQQRPGFSPAQDSLLAVPMARYSAGAVFCFPDQASCLRFQLYMIFAGMSIWASAQAAFSLPFCLCAGFMIQ